MCEDYAAGISMMHEVNLADTYFDGVSGAVVCVNALRGRGRPQYCHRDGPLEREGQWWQMAGKKWGLPVKHEAAKPLNGERSGVDKLKGK